MTPGEVWYGTPSAFDAWWIELALGWHEIFTWRWRRTVTITFTSSCATSSTR
jgi:hypothetical protein